MVRPLLILLFYLKQCLHNWDAMWNKVTQFLTSGGTGGASATCRINGQSWPAVHQDVKTNLLSFFKITTIANLVLAFSFPVQAEILLDNQNNCLEQIKTGPPSPNASVPIFGITGDRFTLNGIPTFLLGVSYFDALGWKVSDFDKLASRRFNLVRIWLDWGVWTDRSRSFFDADGNLVRKPELLNIVRAAAKRGIVVDVTILDSNNASGAGNPENAVRNAVRALSGEPNVFFDLVNEHSRDPGEWSNDHVRVKSLVEIAHAENPKAFVTLSADENHYNESGVGVDLGIGLNLLAPHFGRVNGVFRIGEKVAVLKNKTNLPVYLQEENRRGWRGDFSITKNDFLRAARDAVSAGAAGWVFHTAAGFDLSASSFFDNLDDVERATVDELGSVVFPVPASPSDPVPPPTPKPPQILGVKPTAKNQGITYYRGLWKDASPMPPREYRQSRKN